MSKDKYTSVFSRQKEAIVFIIKYIPSNICDAGKNTVCCPGCSLFSTLRYDVINKQKCPFSVTTPKRSVILNKLLNGGSS